MTEITLGEAEAIIADARSKQECPESKKGTTPMTSETMLVAPTLTPETESDFDALADRLETSPWVMDECWKLAKAESERRWETATSEAEENEVTSESWIARRALEIWGSQGADSDIHPQAIYEYICNGTPLNSDEIDTCLWRGVPVGQIANYDNDVDCDGGYEKSLDLIEMVFGLAALLPDDPTSSKEVA